VHEGGGRVGKQSNKNDNRPSQLGVDADTAATKLGMPDVVELHLIFAYKSLFYPILFLSLTNYS
jgi:hypothetical protein